ncbi:MAG: hypothetical protein ASARMPREDX12_006570 [Alectoria sarmentosa]|nr:MAG: hypothetical protein ASARMPREDX12_006570 [Alectoria sarmentosa]
MKPHDIPRTMQPSPLKGASIREELRLHSRYIRDTLVPLLSKQPNLTRSDSVCLHSIFDTLDTVPMTLDLLRYSRIEKALMVIAASGNACWPMEILVHAEELITKWEDELGPLKNLRADLYGPGGRMEGVRKIPWKDGRVPDDETKSAWSVEGAPKPSRAHAFGHLRFEVGDWWLKPAAAYRDGIIDETSHGITANERGAYAIVLAGSCEMDLGRNGEIRYEAGINDPGVFKLTKTMLREDPEEKVVRVLRSWKLRSKNAPKAGLRYDGLYRILSFSVRLSPPNTWHTAFTLSRLPTQPSLLQALHIPTSDQLDDWKDYQRLKLVDRGDDFAVLREILAQPQGAGEELDDGDGMNNGRHGSEDSGYFSRRGSKAVSAGAGKRDSIFMEELGEMVDIITKEDDKDNDEEAEEADGEGAEIKDLEEEIEKENEGKEGGDGKQEGLNMNVDEDQTNKETIPQPTIPTDPTLTPEPINQSYLQVRIGTRFISPRRPAEPQLSADEAVVARSRSPEVGK